MVGNETRKTMPEFDVSRATLSDKDEFQPFCVNAARPLHEALIGGDVREDTPVLIMEGATKALALLTRQMCYHHVAQGDLAGEPWMVSF